MKPHTRIRVFSAVVGALGVVGMGVVGVSFGDRDVEPQTIVAPATGQMTPGNSGDEVTTTTWKAAPSFRPVITAVPPPPPLD